VNVACALEIEGLTTAKPVMPNSAGLNALGKFNVDWPCTGAGRINQISTIALFTDPPVPVRDGIS
jgi:hypothetical protein